MPTWTDITDTIKQQLINMGYTPILGTGNDYSVAVPWNVKPGTFAYHSGTRTSYIRVELSSGSALVAIRYVDNSWKVVGVKSADAIWGAKVVGDYVYVSYTRNNVYYIDKCNIDLSSVSNIYTDNTYGWEDFYIDESNNLLILMGYHRLSDWSEGGEIRYYNLSTKSYTTLITASYFYGTYVKAGSKLYVGGHGNTKAIVDISNPSSPSASSWTGFNFVFSVAPLYYDSKNNRILVAELGSGTGASQALIWYNISDGSVTTITKPSGYSAAGVSLIAVLPEGLVLAFGVPYGGNGPAGIFLFNPSTGSFTDISVTINNKPASGQSNLLGHDLLSLSASQIVTRLLTAGSTSGTSNFFIYVLTTTAAPIFSITSISPSSITAKVGSQFSVNVTISNSGANGTCQVMLIDDNGRIQDSKQDTVAGNSTKTFTLTGTAPSVVTKVTYTIRYQAV